MNFLDLYKHLLPRGRAWSIIVDKPLRRFFQGLTPVWDSIRTYFYGVYLDLFVDTTRALDEWEDQFGFTQQLNDPQARADRLSAAWKASGGQSPYYIQTTLRNAGFDVYVHEWWEPETLPVDYALRYEWNDASELSDWLFVRTIGSVSGGLLNFADDTGEPSSGYMRRQVDEGLAPFDGSTFNKLVTRWRPNVFAGTSDSFFRWWIVGDEVYSNNTLAFGITDPDPGTETIGPDEDGFYVTTIDFTNVPNWNGQTVTAVRFDWDKVTNDGPTDYDIDYIRIYGENVPNPNYTPPPGLTVRNPLLYLNDDSSDIVYFMEAGEALAQCGEPLAQAGETVTPPGYALVNKINVVLVSGVEAGEELAQCGEPLAQCGEIFGYKFANRTYDIPSDPDTWPYFLYIGGEFFPNMATVDSARRQEFEKLCLKICPAHLWLGMLVNYD